MAAEVMAATARGAVDTVVAAKAREAEGRAVEGRGVAERAREVEGRGGAATVREEVAMARVVEATATAATVGVRKGVC